MKMVPLGDVVSEFKAGFACGESDPNGTAQFRMNNVTTQGGLDFSKVRRVPCAEAQRSKFGVSPGDILFNSTNSPNLVGKSALIGSLDEEYVFSNHFLRLRCKDKVDSGYIARWLQLEYERGVFELRCRQWVNQATLDAPTLMSMELPVPPLVEQRRIAAILDQADAIRAKRRQTLAHLDGLSQAIFHEMFITERPVENVLRFEEIAAISSGITKGRKTVESTRSIPYLAVANVQAGSLRLDGIKHIEATDKEIERYALNAGDLVMTEGGDPDKLGRGTVWRGEIEECLHQNHIFRARLMDDSQISPEFLEAHLASRAAKNYFLRSAKQTTGIASINMTQLRALPVPIPSRADQARFEQRAEATRNLRAEATSALTADDELFASLQSRAFRGEL